MVQSLEGELDHFDCTGVQATAIRGALDRYAAAEGHLRARMVANGEDLAGEAREWFDLDTPYGNPSTEAHYAWVLDGPPTMTSGEMTSTPSDGVLTTTNTGMSQTEVLYIISTTEWRYYHKDWIRIPDYNDSYWSCIGTECVPNENYGEGQGGGEGGGDAWMEDAGDDVSEDVGPNCVSPTDPVVIKWCGGDTLSTSHKVLVAATIARIRAKGGVCDSIGRVLDSVLARGEIRTFNRGPGGTFGGGSPRGGYGDGWILLEINWLTKYPDVNHADQKYANKRTLQSELAHEGDHLMEHMFPGNLPHTANGAFTVNSVRCSEFGEGGG